MNLEYLCTLAHRNAQSLHVLPAYLYSVNCPSKHKENEIGQPPYLLTPLPFQFLLLFLSLAIYIQLSNKLMAPSLAVHATPQGDFRTD
ncbi:hypothetical protein ACTXT7_006274 [Hymenolepis weldensis]